MKISILINHYNRRDLLTKTIESIIESKFINCVEFVIADDASNAENSIDEINTLFPDLNIKLCRITKEQKWWSCPVIPLNKTIAESTGDIILMQGAEILHKGDILQDIVNRIEQNTYLVYGCRSLKADGSDDIWYQHSVINNRCYNFCTAILKSDLLQLGGFDERFAHGVAYGDDDFIMRVRRKGMNIISIDEPFTYHQWHIPMQSFIITDQLHDKELLDYIIANEPGYRVKNSFLKT